MVMMYLKLALTAAIWGGTFIAGRIVAQNMPPFSAAFCRFAIASLCLLVVTQKLEGGLPRLKRHQLWLVTLSGLTGVFAYNAFFFLGLKAIAASRAALIVALNPIFITLCSAIFYKDKLTPLKLSGVVVSLLGAIVVITQGNWQLLAGSLGWGEVFLLGCVGSWVAYTLLGKLVIVDLSPLVATTYACLIGAMALLLPALGEGLLQNIQQISPIAWSGILYLGFLGSALGFSWYYEGVRAIGPAKASVFINLVPVCAVILAALLLREPLTSSLLVGGALVMTGVSLTNKG